MVEFRADRFRVLAAELRTEIERIGQSVEEISDARDQIADAAASRLLMYGAAALLETFYSGVERSLSRIAGMMGGVPEGGAWHRTLLEEMTLEVRKVRPPVLSRAAVNQLDPYLAFRHRFRNLYLFDLDQKLLLPLLSEASEAWGLVKEDLLAFSTFLEQMADRLDQG